MKWASSVSDRASLDQAVGECVKSLSAELGDSPPDLVLAFPSAHHSPQYDRIPALVHEALGPALLLGCSAGGVIGGGREIEQRPGLALTAARMPDVTLQPFSVEDATMPDPDAPPDRWEAMAGVTVDAAPQFILLADPFTLGADRLLAGLDYAFPASAKIGGLASGANRPGGNALFLGETALRQGAIGVAMHGDVTMDTIVAQGCRPIGRPMQITACLRNLLLELDGEMCLNVLRELFARLSQRDQELARHSLFLGVVMDELIERPEQGDFLIRNIMGADGERGALAIGETLKEGQTVQFHLRDATTSAEDLEAVLSRYEGMREGLATEGALLFSCLGRGQQLYGRPDHDTEMFHSKMGPVPLTGFFCNGEIGPVGGATFLHGYTSSFGVFRPRQRIIA